MRAVSSRCVNCYQLDKWKRKNKTKRGRTRKRKVQNRNIKSNSFRTRVKSPGTVRRNVDGTTAKIVRSKIVKRVIRLRRLYIDRCTYVRARHFNINI